VLTTAFHIINTQPPNSTMVLLAKNKKLSYRRVAARCLVLLSILV